MSSHGKHRKPYPGPDELLRRSFLVGGGVLGASAAIGVISAFDAAGSAPERSAALEGSSSRTSAKAARSEAARTSRDSGVRPRGLAPRVYTTAEWGARSPERSARVVAGPPRYVVVHHTFTDNVTDLSSDRGFLLSRLIQEAHKDRGWGDTGQHFTISRGGYVMEGRTGSLNAALKGHFVVGTQVRGANDYTVGIECEGTYNSVMPPAQLRASLVRTCAWLCTLYKLDPREAIVPHMKFNDTDCCGYRFAPTLPSLRADVVKAMRAATR
jgi:hypothetical protein